MSSTPILQSLLDSFNASAARCHRLQPHICSLQLGLTGGCGANGAACAHDVRPTCCIPSCMSSRVGKELTLRCAKTHSMDWTNSCATGLTALRELSLVRAKLELVSLWRIFELLPDLQVTFRRLRVTQGCLGAHDISNFWPFPAAVCFTGCHRAVWMLHKVVLTRHSMALAAPAHARVINHIHPPRSMARQMRVHMVLAVRTQVMDISENPALLAWNEDHLVDALVCGFLVSIYCIAIEASYAFTGLMLAAPIYLLRPTTS